MIILTLLALMGRVELLWRNLLLPLDSQSVSRPRLPPIIKIYRQEKRFLLKIKIWLLKATQLGAQECCFKYAQLPTINI